MLIHTMYRFLCQSDYLKHCSQRFFQLLTAHLNLDFQNSQWPIQYVERYYRKYEYIVLLYTLQCVCCLLIVAETIEIHVKIEHTSICYHIDERDMGIEREHCIEVPFLSLFNEKHTHAAH